MRNFREIFAGVLFLSVSALTLVSCEDNDPVPLQAVADVIVQDMKTDAGVKYGVYVYAIANYDIKSAKVTAPGTGGKVYQLTATTNKQQFVFYPQASDYTAEIPAKGDYTVEIVSTDGETITVKDAVGDEKLTPIVIKTAAMASQKLKTTWDKVTGADAYAVKLYSENKAELLYASDYLASDVVAYEFGESTLGWYSGKSPVANTNYVIELLAVKVETGVTSDKGNNLQFVTLDSKTIKWE
jgi:hypothetical protein